MRPPRWRRLERRSLVALDWPAAAKDPDPEAHETLRALRLRARAPTDARGAARSRRPVRVRHRSARRSGRRARGGEEGGGCGSRARRRGAGAHPRRRRDLRRRRSARQPRSGQDREPAGHRRRALHRGRATRPRRRRRAHLRPRKRGWRDEKGDDEPAEPDPGAVDATAPPAGCRAAAPTAPTPQRRPARRDAPAAQRDDGRAEPRTKRTKSAP